MVSSIKDFVESVDRPKFHQIVVCAPAVFKPLNLSLRWKEFRFLVRILSFCTVVQTICLMPSIISSLSHVHGRFPFSHPTYSWEKFARHFIVPHFNSMTLVLWGSTRCHSKSFCGHKIAR
jgi:hypothetical protein